MRRLGWLPGIRDGDIQQWERLPGDVEVPRLKAAGLDALTERLLQAREGYLAHIPVERIITLLDRVANRWLDPASPYRREAEGLLPAITGYSEPAIRKGLSSFLSLLRRANLERLVEQELADPQVLDGFRPHARGGGQTRAYGPALTVHVWSGNVPGLPAQSLTNGLLVKSACLGKVASEEPLFASLLAESIAEVDERLAECLAVAWWAGGDEELERTAFARADAIIAYGSETAMAAIRGRAPRQARFIEYGHKLSFGAIAREALTAERARDTVDRAAYDVAKYDQQGCLSPHLFYVERGSPISPCDFAERLGQALAGYETLVPRGRLKLEEAASAASLSQRYELRQAAGERVAAIQGGSWAVLYDEDPTFQPSCLNRTVFVKPVADLEEIPTLLGPVRRYLQTCGVAASLERTVVLADALGRLGLDRVCPLGRMADVAPEWHHDGRFNLLDLLRWTDLEPEGSAGRWEFAHPELGLYGVPSPESE